MLQTVTPYVLRVCRSVDTLRRLVILLVLAVCVETLQSAAWGAPAATLSYDIPAGDAARTLRQFVEQSGEQIIYLVPKVRGVRTNPVKGEFTAREVLQRMVANTSLVVVQDEKTGALLINRVTPTRQPAPPAATSQPTDNPPSQKSSQRNSAQEPASMKTASMKTQELFTRIAAIFALMLAPTAGAAEAFLPA